MSNQILKFAFEGTEYKMFFRYPDRVTAKLTAEQRQELLKEQEAVAFKKTLITELLKSISDQVSPEDFEIVVKANTTAQRKGSGPITAEFYIVYESGRNAEGKPIFTELNLHSKARFHSSSVRNSYEKARQYAIHNYFKSNQIIEDSELYNSIIKSYEDRADNMPKFCRDIKDIEKLTV